MPLCVWCVFISLNALSLYQGEDGEAGDPGLPGEPGITVSHDPSIFSLNAFLSLTSLFMLSFIFVS